MNAVTKSPRARAALYTLISACVALGTGAAVQAGETCASATEAAHGAHAITVRYGDLDVSTREGASALYARINHAAHEVCATDEPSNVYAVQASHACVRQAVAQAAGAVHSPQLAALVSQKMPQG
jgi:UrcA family protein